MQAETPNTSKPRRTFDRESVRVDTHGSNGPYNPKPAVNVKVRTGFESLKPEDWESIRATIRDYEAGLAPETVERFGREWIEERFALSKWSKLSSEERAAQAQFYEVWYSEACSAGFEQAQEDAQALFGEHVKCYSAGRSGGWLIVEGLPDVEDWDTEDGYPIGSMPSLKGSRCEGASFQDGTKLDSEAGLFERWAFFVEACEALAAETPYRCADLLAVNVFAREEVSREVEYLRALDGGRWDTVRFKVPQRIEDADALVAYLEEHAPERVPDFAHVFVLRDPAPKVTAEELEAD